MLHKAFKQGLGLACVMAVLAGCSSTSTTDENASTAADQGVNTGTTSQQDVSATQEPVVALETVFYFDFDQAVLKPESRTALLGHAEQLKAAPRSIRLEGHADERGTREYNMALGERRANAVRDFLVLQGVNGSDLEVISYGEERPESLGSNESSYAANRRVELK